MTSYCVTTTFDDDPGLSLAMTVRAASEEAAIQSILSYLRMEFELPPDATYRYRVS